MEPLNRALQDLKAASRHLELASRRLGKQLDTRPAPPRELREEVRIISQRTDPGFQNEARLSKSLDDWRFLACELMRENGMSMDEQIERLKQNGLH